MTYAENIQPYLRKNRGIFQQHLFVGTSNPYEGAEVNVLQVVVTRGLQASGKSTWAKLLAEHKWARLLAEPSENGRDAKECRWIRICKDDIRSMMGEYWIPGREEYITSCVKSMIYGALMEGYCVVFDGLGLKEHTIHMIQQVCMDAARDRWLLQSIRCKVELFYKDFPSNIEDCIKRDEIGAMACTRRRIGESVIRETAKTYEAVLKTLRSYDSAPYEVCNWTYYDEG